MTTDIKVSIDVVNGLRAQLSNAQSELEYWKKIAELAESLIVVSMQNKVPTNHHALKQYWDLWIEHKNSKP